MIKEITAVNAPTSFEFFSNAHKLFTTYKIFDDKYGFTLRCLAGLEDSHPNPVADGTHAGSVSDNIVISNEAYSHYSGGFWLFAQLANWHNLRNTEHRESYLLETLHYNTLKWLHNFENLLILQELSSFELLTPFKEELNNLNSEIKEFTQNYRALLLEQYSFFHLHYQILEYLLKIEELNRELKKIEGEKNETSLCKHLSNTISPLIKILKEMISSDNYCQPVGLMHLANNDRSKIQELSKRISEIRIDINNLQRIKLFYDEPKLMEQVITTFNELANLSGSLKSPYKTGFFSGKTTTVIPLLEIYQPQPHSEAIEQVELADCPVQSLSLGCRS